MISVIGISGVARVGKDTFFRAIKKENPNGTMIRVAFADELKEECNNFLMENVGVSAFTQDTNEKALVRPFLVTYGSQLRRKQDPDCWIKKVSRKIKNLPSGNWKVVITDVRYPNELDWIHNEMRGTSIHISREGLRPVNEEEEENDPILKRMCKNKITIPNFNEHTCEKNYTEFVSKMYEDNKEMQVVL